MLKFIVMSEQSEIAQLKKRISHNSALLETLGRGEYKASLIKSLKNWKAAINLEESKKAKLYDRLEGLTDFERVRRRLQLCNKNLTHLRVNEALLKEKLKAAKAELSRYQEFMSKRVPAKYAEGSIAAAPKPKVFKSLHVESFMEMTAEMEEADGLYMIAD